MIYRKIAAAAVIGMLGTGIAAAQQQPAEKQPGPAEKQDAPRSEPPGKSQAPARQPQGQPKAEQKFERKQADPKEKQPARKEAQPQKREAVPEKSTRPRETSPPAERKAEPKEKSAPADRQADPKGKALPGTPKEAAPKSPAAPEKQATPQPDTATPPPATAKEAQPKSGPGATERVQVSQEQRRTVRERLFRERQVNRVTQVNFRRQPGTRVPRSVRLAVLPATVLTIVPAYRSYRYFVVEDEICIVDPATYEIVDVIVVTEGGATVARLVLAEDEQDVIRAEIIAGGSLPGPIEAIVEGGDVPRGLQVREFPDRVVAKIPKVRGYRYVAVQNRVAIVEPQRDKIAIVISVR